MKQLEHGLLKTSVYILIQISILLGMGSSEFGRFPIRFEQF